MSQARIDERRKDFKKKLDMDDLRRRRSSETNQLRKSKKEESLQKRRNGGCEDVALTASSATAADNATANDTSATERSREIVAAVELVKLGDNGQIRKILEAFESSDVNAVIAATTQIRRMLSIERDPPIDQILAMGVLPRLVQYLTCYAEHPKLTLEAAWAVTNIASGTAAHTRAVVDAGAVPIFVALLGSADVEVRDQSVWALGNIAGDGAALRDLCLQHGVMNALLCQYDMSPSVNIVRNTTWAISNLCRGKPQPNFDAVSMCIPKLAELLVRGDTETIIDAAWALSYLTDGDNHKIQSVVDSGVCARLVSLLSSDDKLIQTPALRAVGNIVTGTKEQTQAIVDLNPFEALEAMLHSKKKAIVKEAAWCISNITAGEPNQVQAVISSGIMSTLAHVMLRGDAETKKEACWAVSNATTGGTVEQIRQFVDQATVEGLIEMLRFPDAKLVVVSLEAIENVLRAGDTSSGDFKTATNITNPYAEWFAELDGVQQLENLQDSKNDAIYERAASIMEEFFECEAEEAAFDAENVLPNTTLASQGQAQFAFGVSHANNSSSSFAF